MVNLTTFILKNSTKFKKNFVRGFIIIPSPKICRTISRSYKIESHRPLYLSYFEYLLIQIQILGLPHCQLYRIKLISGAHVCGDG